MKISGQKLHYNALLLLSLHPERVKITLKTDYFNANGEIK